MARDIIVTTPRSEMASAAAEAENVKRGGSGFYYRSVSSLPSNIENGVSRIFYVEDGYIRGFAVIVDTCFDEWRCLVTGKTWSGHKVISDALSWNWIKPIPMRGFRGWRYFDAPADLKVIGGWRDRRPTTP